MTSEGVQDGGERFDETGGGLRSDSCSEGNEVQWADGETMCNGTLVWANSAPDEQGVTYKNW
jgi:hypothetical protein